MADFIFTVEGMPFEPANLLPFRVQECNGEKIFDLKIVHEFPEVDKELLYKVPEQSGFPVIALFRLNGGYMFETQPMPGKPLASRLMVDAGFKKASLQLIGKDQLFALNNAMMLLFTFSTATKGGLEMHSSVVMHDGKGYMFLGKSGTGKSTHSQLWMKNIPDTELLNDDNPVVRLLSDGSVRVYGSPWSGKTPCYKAQDVPVGAIVRLNQAPYNKIERLPVIQAYASLMASASSFRPLKDLSDGWHRTMEGICASVPFYNLECLPDNEAAILCYKTVHG